MVLGSERSFAKSFPFVVLLFMSADYCLYQQLQIFGIYKKIIVNLPYLSMPISSSLTNLMNKYVIKMVNDIA